MKRKFGLRWAVAALVGTGALTAAGVTAGPSYAADDAELYVVQALPGQQLDIAVDGKTVAKNVQTSKVAGPFSVPAGQRELTVRSGNSVVLDREVTVKAKSSWDVVVHLPANPSGKPVMTVFRNDLSDVPKGKAALTVAHTAAVPPADIQVNGKVLFRDIGNGESLHVVVPVATYRVAIVKTGANQPVYLGPLSLTVKGGALNRVYAVGDPRQKTMNVALHVLATGSRGSAQPSEVNTGSGGQAVGQGQVYVDLWR